MTMSPKIVVIVSSVALWGSSLLGAGCSSSTAVGSATGGSGTTATGGSNATATGGGATGGTSVATGGDIGNVDHALGGAAGAGGVGGAAGVPGVWDPCGHSSGGGGSQPAPPSHRPTAVACATSTGASHPHSADTSCVTDDDCIGYAEGLSLKGVCLPSKECSYDQCQTDDDCGAGKVCRCQGSWFGWSHVSAGNSCAPSNCRVDSDCAAGTCDATWGWNQGSFYGVAGYYCRTPQDTCHTDADCCGGYCAYNPEVSAWACATFSRAG